MEWDSEQEQSALQKINENSQEKLGQDQQGTLLYFPTFVFCLVMHGFCYILLKVTVIS